MGDEMGCCVLNGVMCGLVLCNGVDACLLHDMVDERDV